MKICRSVLFTPGIDRHKIDKAMDLRTDVILLELEDAVSSGMKDAARDIVAGVLQRPGRKKTLWVRINPPGTDHFYRDLLAVVPAGPDGIMVAKVDSAELLSRVDWLIGLLESHHGLAGGSIELIPMIESATGIRNAYEIAGCSPRIKRITFGAVDFTQDLGVDLTAEGTELIHARSVLVLASRDAGLRGPLDAVYPNIRDEEGMIVAARAARRLGFHGKLVIHPNQIKIVNDTFSPSPDEIVRAEKIIKSYEDAVAGGRGIAELEGKLVEKPIYERAKRVLAEAEAAR